MNSIVALPLVASPVSSPLIAHGGLGAMEEGDNQILDIAAKIFDLREEIVDLDPEIDRLAGIWLAETSRLRGLDRATRTAIVAAMPECIEHTRLVDLQNSLSEKQGELVKQVMAIPAQTRKGRAEKFFVLLACVMPTEWSEADENANYDIKIARNFMIELIGGETADELRDQFA